MYLEVERTRRENKENPRRRMQKPGRKRRKKRVIEEEPEVRPDLITIVVESCIGTRNTLLGFKFLGRVMSELATVGSTVDTAIEYLQFLKQNHLPFFARSSHNNKVSNKTEKDDDDVDTESESFHILKRQQAVEQTYVFCLHVFDTMHNLALSSCENSETNGKAALLSLDCWEILRKVLSPYIYLAKLLDDKDIFSYIDKISTVLHQDSFRLALSWKSCKMYFDELVHNGNNTNSDRHEVSVTMLQHSIDGSGVHQVARICLNRRRRFKRRYLSASDPSPDIIFWFSIWPWTC